MSNNYGDLGTEAGVYAEMKMLEHADPILVLNKLGDHKPMPKNASKVIKFRRPQALPLATTPLTEGVRPAGSNFRYDRITATLQQYGDWMELTDVVADLHEDPVGSDMSMMAGEQAAETIETVCFGELIGGTNVIYANGVARNEVTATINLGAIRKAVRTLMSNKAKRLTSILSGSAMIGTSPIEAAYVGVCHTDIVASLRSVKGFTPVAEYGSRKPICAEEVGSIEDVRFVASPLFNSWVDAGGAKGTGAEEAVSTTGTSADVYPVLIMGQHAFGHIALKGNKDAGGAIKPMVRNPGKPEKGDELGQTGSVAWKTFYVAKILNDLWMVRLECTALENPQD
ncbi:N4-gp56 family major capsid protein [Pseudoalteromonas nigrifaciens]|uniref:N4-gp56 family major capsid protein n=1 Tax=Pseudoalteromonas nigrifaciens TaxID=28109 RepID=UPI0017882B0A|nr:N4-gp56 family major capsid protein [Pseudoalteromonas nigrifaciens]MBE0418554.1 N4-gp56 family major capsid protein [Pseudoalteromonas nigrifaciens]